MVSAVDWRERAEIGPLTCPNAMLRLGPGVLGSLGLSRLSNADQLAIAGALRSVQMNSNLYNPMMRSNSFGGLMRAAAAIVALTAAMFLHVAATENLQGEYARIADWRAKRLASLTSETGWLTPIALYWLKDGENSFGRAPDRAFSVDDAALAADTGAFVLTNGRVRYVAHASKAMTYLGKPVTSIDLVSDADE